MSSDQRIDRLNIQIDTLAAQDLPQLALLQKKYLAIYPGALVMPGEVYLSPDFAGGQNIFCARDEAGNLAGFAPLYPNLVEQGQHSLWLEYLHRNGLQQALLEVKAANQAALGLYQAAGYQVQRESWFLLRCL